MTMANDKPNCYDLSEGAKTDPLAQEAISSVGTKRREYSKEAENKAQNMSMEDRMERHMTVGRKVDVKY